MRERPPSSNGGDPPRRPRRVPREARAFEDVLARQLAGVRLRSLPGGRDRELLGRDRTRPDRAVLRCDLLRWARGLNGRAGRALRPAGVSRRPARRRFRLGPRASGVSRSPRRRPESRAARRAARQRVATPDPMTRSAVTRASARESHQAVPASTLWRAHRSDLRRADHRERLVRSASSGSANTLQRHLTTSACARGCAGSSCSAATGGPTRSRGGTARELIGDCCVRGQPATQLGACRSERSQVSRRSSASIAELVARLASPLARLGASAGPADGRARRSSVECRRPSASGDRGRVARSDGVARPSPPAPRSFPRTAPRQVADRQTIGRDASRHRQPAHDARPATQADTPAAKLIRRPRAIAASRALTSSRPSRPTPRQPLDPVDRSTAITVRWCGGDVEIAGSCSTASPDAGRQAKTSGALAPGNGRRNRILPREACALRPAQFPRFATLTQPLAQPRLARSGSVGPSRAGHQASCVDEASLCPRARDRQAPAAPSRKSSTPAVRSKHPRGPPERTSWTAHLARDAS